ncbi:MinD-like ATPase involved in chromosome partitioning or flagellar assembly [Homoserinimonas aerilata]|uniref:MinD-like ATPase involved in chromosome partitioning or flagellar assembly n=1 Tax=Homoserinimonas aerilata TaxID=1162970 RepID=A0A542YHA9_9MICO|nr:regulator [Homoserinimonas aerilata]TQL47480.1 MinD-like ATPase involved in chromosome partitioning or flagellar assembly [Homoserinimonas aerilata]
MSGVGRIALAVVPGREGGLIDDVAAHGYDVTARCSSADELASVLAASRSDFAIVSSVERYLNPRLVAEADAAGVRIVAIAETDAGRRHAANIGLHEVVEGDADWARIEAVLLGAPLRAEALPGPTGGRGNVIAVWGPAGAPGRTTLAINIAAELASAGHTVALADVDTHSGSVAPTLGLLDEAPGFAAACRLAGSGALTRAELERIGQRYSSPHGSFWVLTGIGRPSRWPELSAERVVATLAECRKWVDYTVVDTGFNLEGDEEIVSDLAAPRRNAATIAALREADQVVAVGSADPVGLSRFLRAHVDLLETIVTERILVVMNRLRSSAIGSSPAAQVTQSLERFGGITAPVMVPYDRQATDAAVLTGATLYDVAAKSPARVAIGALVTQRILPPAAALPDRRRGIRWPSRARNTMRAAEVPAAPTVSRLRG